ncbi:MAG: gliding motility protein GldL [Dysgonamonadaceae bacterium]|jgi:gliding motility-associated protein GldL|nr:gliding motility protein GldL [Dysgonamonadaceae bacterium]
MGIKRKYKNFVEKFLAKDQGKRFFQFFYSIGASVVIIGALAKINHWEKGSEILTIGMVFEAVIFFVSAFDRPSKEYQWDRVFPVLETGEEDDRPDFKNGKNGASSNTEASTGVSGSGGTVIIGGASFGREKSPQSHSEAVENMSTEQVRQSFGISNAVDISEEDTNALTASIKKMAAAADHLSKMAEMTDATQEYLNQVTSMSEDMKKFSEVTNNLTNVSDILLNSYKSITDNSDGINQSSKGYVLQMESLNRNIQGLNTIYEIQLKSISSQIDAIERINSGLMRIKDLYDGSIVDSSVFRSETEKMAQQLQQLNGVYSRLLNAMTVNMYTPPAYPQQPTGGYNPQPPVYPQNPGQGNPNV